MRCSSSRLGLQITDFGLIQLLTVFWTQGRMKDFALMGASTGSMSVKGGSGGYISREV